MFKAFQKQTAVNLITGSLGAGKTTLLRNFLKQKPTDQHWGVLVNEFGAIGIDGAILSEQSDITVAEIPGGCICCSAQGELKDAIEQLLKEHSLDRLFIEPTGLGEPDVLVDMLQSPFFQQRFKVENVFAVLDASMTKLEDFSRFVIMQNLVNMADVIVLNKCDLASQQQIEELHGFADSLYPQKRAVISTSQADVSASMLASTNDNTTHNDTAAQNMLFNQPKSAQSLHHSIQPSQDKPTLNKVNQSKLPGLVERKMHNQLNTLSIGWIFNPEQEFDWAKLFNLFKSLQEMEPQIKPRRAKGVFRVGEPRMLFQWVNNTPATREYIAYRRDSRLELLLPEDTAFNIEQFEQQLQSCQKS